MTNPSGPFEYNDDSVVARVSVDIPNQAVTDIAQLTSAMSAMRTELEAISRAQSDWLSYLQEMPVIVEQSNQALRNQITLMERMSYLQGEVGSAGRGAGPEFSGGAGGDRGGGNGSGGSVGGYSTAAPAGYQNPFANMLSGTGERGGAGGGGGLGDLAEATAGVDARTYANMAAARGMPINPATLGAIGSAAAAYLGMKGGNGGGPGNGGDPADSQSPQKGNNQRTSGKPPNQNARGQSIDAENQDDPGAPTADSPAWRRAIDEVTNSAKQAIQNRGGILGGAARVAGAANSAGFGPKGMMKGLGLAGAGLVAATQAQNIGESITEYQQLGSVRGGDYMTGIGMEIENRIRALDPFVNLPQTREAMQAAYSAGFSGDDVSQVQSMAITNFKELGISMQDTARTMQAAVLGFSDKEAKDGGTLETRTLIEAALNTMKELSADGGASFPDRAKQLQAAIQTLVAAGMDPATVTKGELQLQQGYGDEKALKDTVSATAASAVNSPTLSVIAASRLGMGGIVPSALPAAFAEAGISQADILDIVAGEAAQSVAGMSPRLNKIGTFWDLLRMQGADIPTYEAAEALYDKVSGGKRPSQEGAEKVKAQGTQKNHQTNWNPFGFIGDVLAPTMNAKSLDDFKNIPGDTYDAIRGYHEPSESSRANAELMDAQPRNAAALPTSASTAPASVSTQGSVTGNITITVDQNGNVSAPKTITLTGTQQSAFSGWGSAQVNNISPGESHAVVPLGGG